MRIQFASDLHLEFADNWRFLKQHPLEKTGDVLVLAGDIGYLGDDNYSTHPFWDIVAEQYEQVLVVPGNHEFYKFYDLATLKDGELLQIRPNVRVYYNAVVTLGDVDFILSTMWAHIPLFTLHCRYEWTVPGQKAGSLCPTSRSADRRNSPAG